VAEDGGSELVARLVDEGAGEVLAVADDDALGKCGFEGVVVGGVRRGDGEGVNSASGRAKTRLRIVRGLAKRTAVPAALRTE
jgi:hypothetical protein